MNISQVLDVLAVAKYQNFSRAAEQLRITQPAVSHQINTLEDELGVKLFHRTSKSVRLTQEGFLFLQYAGEILKLSALSKAADSGQKLVESGNIKDSKYYKAAKVTLDEAIDMADNWVNSQAAKAQ